MRKGPGKNRKNHVPKSSLGEGGASDIGALEILALPKMWAGSDPCQDFFGGFVEVSQKTYSGITQSQKLSFTQKK